jgi:branched-chain amino acid transport system substrate-binding protein
MIASLFAALLAAYALPALAQAPLKLGLLLDMSGPYADIGGQGSVTAARMAVEEFGGKVLGRPIEIVFADHQNKADLAASLARQWFDDQGVETILDVAASGPALAVNEIAKQRNKILILNGPAARRLTNEDCGPDTVHYTYDNYALARGTGEATVKAGYDSWFFITADYVFGKDLETITSAFVIKNGGKVVGSVRAPLNSPDFSSFLLQAQASRAQVVGLANSGADTINAIKQAADFGVGKSGQKLVALLLFITDVNALGLEAAQGLLLTEAFYWDMNDGTRAWSRSYFDKMKKMPNMTQAGVYSSTLHYLKAVEAAGTVESSAVMKMMKATPINDFFAHDGRIREDGRMVHDMYLFEVKKPTESKEPWDDYKLVATIPAEEAFQPLSQSTCPLVKK